MRVRLRTTVVMLLLRRRTVIFVSLTVRWLVMVRRRLGIRRRLRSLMLSVIVILLGMWRWRGAHSGVRGRVVGMWRCRVLGVPGLWEMTFLSSIVVVAAMLMMHGRGRSLVPPARAVSASRTLGITTMRRVLLILG